MSSVMRPSGKLPPGVYWRRRIVVAVVVLLVVWLVSRVVGGGDDADAKAPKSPASPSATPSGPAPTTPPPTPRSRKAKDVEVGVRLGTVSGSCAPASVQVVPSVAAGTLAGRAIPVTLRVVTSAKEPCTVRIDPTTFVLEVRDSDGQVWDTQTCDRIRGLTVDVHPTWATVVDVPWSGRADGDGCDKEGAFVKPGAYEAKAALLGGEPAIGEFTLAAPPTPTPTPTPTPPPTTKPTAPAATGKPSTSPSTAQTP
ncbi:hypothetical protein [Mumia zhuanghuii]|uniref:hypothetical protein n=1 Tax=Mumia zhuanghuii TaxID=2585211 RepID=UPI00363203A3